MWERLEAGPACLVFSRPVAYHLPLRFPMAATFQMGTYCSWHHSPKQGGTCQTGMVSGHSLV